MSRTAHRLIGTLTVAAVFGAGISVGVYQEGGAATPFFQLSPDGKERVDLHHATRWQAHRMPNADSPGFIRLARLAGDEPLGTPAPSEMSGSGKVTWDETGVHVGSTATFDKRTGRWMMDRSVRPRASSLSALG